MRKIQTRPPETDFTDGQEKSVRCVGCFRPQSLCYCDSIPAIKNQTEILLIQHIRERDHPFNTARMVHRALAKSQLIFGTKKSLANKELKIHEGAGLLFPTADSVELSQLAAVDRPQQLVVIDGTWAQAKSIVNSLPQLRGLPRYHLSPTKPGQYRIRLEPNDTSLSTVEATVAALKSLEPETPNVEKLLITFETMIQKQLDHPKVQTEHYSGGPISGATFNIPRQLAIDPDKIIVAYGEASYRDASQPHNAPREPVYWCSQNFGTGESFVTTIKATNPITETFLQHLDLPAGAFDNAIPQSQFLNRWNDFSQKAELIVAYNEGTFRLIPIEQTNSVARITLRAINYPEELGVARSLPNVVKALGMQLSEDGPGGRGARRLDSTTALLNFLRIQLNSWYS